MLYEVITASSAQNSVGAAFSSLLKASAVSRRGTASSGLPDIRCSDATRQSASASSARSARSCERVRTNSEPSPSLLEIV